MQCKCVEIRGTYLRILEKQARKVLGDQEENHSSRLRPVERKYLELGNLGKQSVDREWGYELGS